jgi:hypothetical protein
MKFTRTAGTDGVDTYGRWVSEDGRYSVQRFEFKKIRGIGSHERVKPYYSAFYVADRSQQIATNLKTWRDVVDAIENHQSGPEA